MRKFDMSSSSVRAALALVFLGSTSLTARAQTASPVHAGGWLIGGAATIAGSHDDNSGNRTDLSISPSGLAFVTSHLAVGGSVLLGYGDGGGVQNTLFGVGPSARYYFSGANAVWLPFISATATPTWSHSERSGSSPAPSSLTSNSRVLSLDGSLGLTRLVATHVGITSEAFYTNSSLQSDAGGVARSTDRASRYGLRFGVSVFVH
jgi:hypothetical protein